MAPFTELEKPRIDFIIHSRLVYVEKPSPQKIRLANSLFTWQVLTIIFRCVPHFYKKGVSVKGKSS